MKRTLDLQKFYQNLLALPVSPAPTPPANVCYLMDALIAPLLEERRVDLESLDYSRFEQEDLDDLDAYIGKLSKRYIDLLQMCGSLEKLPALCAPFSVFC